MRVWFARRAAVAFACCAFIGISAAIAPSAAAAAGETVLPFGDAGFFGSTASVANTQPVTSMATTPDGHGYWETASDGGVFAFGDAGFYGSMGGVRLNEPVTGMAATPDGGGYWLAAADGGVFAFGDAGFYGSGTPIPGIQPVSGIAATPDGRGYWLAARDGGVFTFGSAGFYGSASGLTPGRLVVGIEGTPSGMGYWLLVRNTPVGPVGPPGSPPASNPAPTLPPGTPPVALGVNVYFGQLGKVSCDAVFPVLRAVQPPQVLVGAMNALLSGPTPSEQAAGYASFFSSRTAGMLNWAHVSNGVARIDFADFSTIIPNASSSCGGAALLASLDTTAEQFASVNSAVYSFNGNVRAFYLWLQLAPPPGY